MPLRVNRCGYQDDVTEARLLRSFEGIENLGNWGEMRRDLLITGRLDKGVLSMRAHGELRLSHEYSFKQIPESVDGGR